MLGICLHDFALLLMIRFAHYSLLFPDDSVLFVHCSFVPSCTQLRSLGACRCCLSATTSLHWIRMCTWVISYKDSLRQVAETGKIGSCCFKVRVGHKTSRSMIVSATRKSRNMGDTSISLQLALLWRKRWPRKFPFRWWSFVVLICQHFGLRIIISSTCTASANLQSWF